MCRRNASLAAAENRNPFLRFSKPCPHGPTYYTTAAAEARTCLTTNYYVYSRLREGQEEAEFF